MLRLTAVEGTKKANTENKETAEDAKKDLIASSNVVTDEFCSDLTLNAAEYDINGKVEETGATLGDLMKFIRQSQERRTKEHAEGLLTLRKEINDRHS